MLLGENDERSEQRTKAFNQAYIYVLSAFVCALCVCMVTTQQTRQGKTVGTEQSTHHHHDEEARREPLSASHCLRTQPLCSMTKHKLTKGNGSKPKEQVIVMAYFYSWLFCFLQYTFLFCES